MATLPPANWRLYLQRISQRYQNQLVTLRHQEHARDEAQVLLWRVPLRLLSADADEEGATIAVEAGYEEPYITLTVGPVQRITLTLTPDNALEQLRLSNHDGSFAMLLFKLPGY